MSDIQRFYEAQGVSITNRSGAQLVGTCPFCQKEKHFYIGPNACYDCKVCGVEGNATTFLKRNGLSGGDIRAELQRYGLTNGKWNTPTNRPTPSKRAVPANHIFDPTTTIDKYQISDARLKAFADGRGLPVEILNMYQLGWDGHAFTLPVWTPSGKLTDIRRRPPGGKEVSKKGSRLGIFAIKNLLQNETVYVAEGCCDAMMLESNGFPAIGVPGAGLLPKAYAKYFDGKTVVFVYDVDEPGRKGVLADAAKIQSHANVLKSVDFTPYANGQDGFDVSDFFKNGGTAETFRELIAKASTVTVAEPQPTEREQAEPEQRITVAEALTRICEQHVVKFVQDRYANFYVLLPCGDHNELWPTTSGAFRRWLAEQYRSDTGKPPGSEAIQQAKLQVEAMCEKHERRQLHNRVAWHDDKLIYDLTNDLWEGVEIGKDGWRVVNLPPIFRRYKQQQAQTTPVKGGDPQNLLNFLNVSEQDQCLLMVAVASWFIPDIPHPALIFHGEQGAAKTSTCRILKRLVDPVGPLTSPETPATLAAPKEQRELVQQLDHNWVALYDNISHLNLWMSDALCRAVTGEGIIVRALYSDDEDFIRGYRRCVGLTGINNPVLRGDMLDRSILVELNPISAGQRKDEQILHREFENVLPGILGGFLDAISTAMQGVDQVPRKNLPRMADFGVWGQVLAPALGFPTSQFINDYAGAIDEKWHDAVESNTFAQQVVSFIQERRLWEGTATDLYDALSQDWPEKANERKAKGLPGNVRAMLPELKRQAPALRQVGVDVDTSRRDSKTKRRWIVLRSK